MSKEEFIKFEYIIEFINYINKKNYSIHTLDSYIDDLYYSYVYINKELIYVDENDIRDYINNLGKLKKNASTISRHISTYKTFYKFLYKNNIINKKDYPLNKITYPKKEKRLPKFLYYNELLDIIKESEKSNDGIRNRLIIEMLYATGVRISELINIKLSDIDTNSKKIVVLGKGNKERIVYYGEYAEEVMNKYLATHNRKDNNYLFVNSYGNPLSDRGVRYIIDNIMKKLSIKTHVTPHVLRHTFATDMLNNGCDIKIVQELLGHASLRSTEVYTHVTNDRIKKVYYDCFKRSEN